MTKEYISSDPLEMVSQVIEEMKKEQEGLFDINNINLAELSRRTGLSRSKLRTMKRRGFVSSASKRNRVTKLTGYTEILDDFLRNNVSNSVVCYEHLKTLGYTGGQTIVRDYLRAHKDLLPPARQAVAPQGNRGRRYETGPGESYQMDWGFLNVDTPYGTLYRTACFAMICHHCGMCYVEFFPDAKQESLFIGMVHAFQYMGVPKYVLTDNMKSVVISRDGYGHPIWQKDYEVFMKTIGFQTKLCKPRHPFTKGKVERLVRYVKDNFAAGRTFGNITDLNIEAMNWCEQANHRYRNEVEGVPAELHEDCCMSVAQPIVMDIEVHKYLCPLRRISFDGFINYEGRRFGVPFRYHKKMCRVKRSQFDLYIYSDDLSEELVVHNVTWSKKDSYCTYQYDDRQPEELPSAPVRTVIRQIEEMVPDSAFEKFNFAKAVNWDD